MTRQLDRWLPCATLAAWGAVLLSFYFSGRIAPLLHPSFRPGALLAGLTLVALGIAFAWLPRAEGCCAEDQCSHPLGRMTLGRVLTFLILLVPIATAAMFSPSNFSATTFANRGVITDAQSLAPRPSSMKTTTFTEPPLPTKDGSIAPEETAAAAPVSSGPLQVGVVDLLYAAQDPSLRVDFENKKIEMIGQVMADTVTNATGKRFKLVRMLMNCCAADARPIATLVEGPGPLNAPEMAWVKVMGTATFPVESGRVISVVKAESVSQTEPPAETMLY